MKNEFLHNGKIYHRRVFKYQKKQKIYLFSVVKQKQPEKITSVNYTGNCCCNRWRSPFYFIEFQVDYSFFGRVPGRHYFWFDHLKAGVKEEAAKFFSHRLFYNLCYFWGNWRSTSGHNCICCFVAYYFLGKGLLRKITFCTCLWVNPAGRI